MNPPLRETRVLDFSIWRPGPYATQLFAGADDDVRGEPPGSDPMMAFPALIMRRSSRA